MWTNYTLLFILLLHHPVPPTHIAEKEKERKRVVNSGIHE